MNTKSCLVGTWLYQSFLILSAETEQGTLAGSPAQARKWAKGTLTIAEDAGNQIVGELVFAPEVALSVNGCISPATETLPAVFTASGKGLEGATKGAIYQISGWMIPSPDPSQRPTIRGSVLAVRGTDAKPEIELGGEPVGTVGAFVLSPI